MMMMMALKRLMTVLVIPIPQALNVIMIIIVIWNNCISCLNQDIVIDTSMMIRGQSD